MTTTNYKKELELAVKAARLAGDFLQNNKKDVNKILFSSDKDIKLKADLEAEKIIKKVLVSESNIPILAEETGLTAKSLPEVYWVVDPLDGTANYSRDIPICCVSVALVAQMQPLLGVIYDFNNDCMFEGSDSSKALCNKKAIEVSKINNKADGILLTGLPNDTNYSDYAMEEMINDFQKWRKVRMIGSAAISAVYVASGRADVYSEKKSYIWDVAAGAAIVNAAGGKAIIKNKNEKFQVDVLFSNSLIKI